MKGEQFVGDPGEQAAASLVAESALCVGGIDSVADALRAASSAFSVGVEVVGTAWVDGSKRFIPGVARMLGVLSPSMSPDKSDWTYN